MWLHVLLVCVNGFVCGSKLHQTCCCILYVLINCKQCKITQHRNNCNQHILPHPVHCLDISARLQQEFCCGRLGLLTPICASTHTLNIFTFLLIVGPPSHYITVPCIPWDATCLFIMRVVIVNYSWHRHWCKFQMVTNVQLTTILKFSFGQFHCEMCWGCLQQWT